MLLPKINAPKFTFTIQWNFPTYFHPFLIIDLQYLKSIRSENGEFETYQCVH